MLNKTIIPLILLLQLVLSPCLNAQNGIQIQKPASWQQIKEAQVIQNGIHTLGSYKTSSPDLFAVVITTPISPVNYASARDFVERTQQGYEVQKLDVAKPYPTHQLNLPGMAVGAYGNNLHNLSLCLFTTEQAIQLNFFCSKPISPESPKVQEFIHGIRLGASVKPATLTQEDLTRMTKAEMKPEEMKRYGIYAAVAVLGLILVIRVARRSKN